MSPADPAFVQFPHPGREHGPDQAGGDLKSWERGENEHRRKFMASPGAWVADLGGSVHDGEVAFWGEWEAGSTVQPVPTTVSDGPSWIHRPFFDGHDGRPEGIPQNTDPFVFGDRFLYTFCRQPRNRKLRELASGSLILFGSKRRGEFVLDTAFVVADAVRHSRADYAQTAVPASSEVFREVTLEPMYAWEGVTGGTMYRGATVATPAERMYSFVPCLPAGGRTFARPAIELPGLVNGNLAMAAKVIPSTPPRLREIWADVVSQVLRQGLALGVRVDAPNARST